MDAKKFFELYQDYLAPKLDTYEQAIYLYIVRHSRLVGLSEVVLGFKSARARMATGIGEGGKPMAENTCYRKLRNLHDKGCIEILGSESTGTRIKVMLPEEIPGVIINPDSVGQIDIETIDFFEDTAMRLLILEREQKRCFYCFRQLNKENWVAEHVISRPAGDNSYRNIVAGCRPCNNKKGSTPALEFVRQLYRDGLLDQDEHQGRLNALERLVAGELTPVLGP